MSVDSRYLIDFQKRVIKGISGYSAERGYVTGAFPFIPENTFKTPRLSLWPRRKWTK